MTGGEAVAALAKLGVGIELRHETDLRLIHPGAPPREAIRIASRRKCAIIAYLTSRRKRSIVGSKRPPPRIASGERDQLTDDPWLIEVDPSLVPVCPKCGGLCDELRGNDSRDDGGGWACTFCDAAAARRKQIQSDLLAFRRRVLRPMQTAGDVASKTDTTPEQAPHQLAV